MGEAARAPAIREHTELSPSGIPMSAASENSFPAWNEGAHGLGLLAMTFGSLVNSKNIWHFSSRGCTPFYLRLGPSVIVEELTRHEFEFLSDDGSRALFRGRSRDRQGSILVRCPSGKSFTTAEYEGPSRANSLANEFDGAWAARPPMLGERAGRPVLVIDDPGGSPLSSARRQSLDRGHFLNIALATARALRHLHDKGLIYRDLRPANCSLMSSARCG